MSGDSTDAQLRVLRVLRLKGRADADVVAAATGLGASEVQEVLHAAAERDEVVEKNGRHRLSPAGRERLDSLLDAARDAVDSAALEVMYERFHAPNDAIKRLMTDWQLRDGEPNDHADRTYDEDVAGRVSGHHRDVAMLVDEIGAASPVLVAYPRRLREAADRVAAGDHDHIAGPLIDSYHTVWFELHEDLITLLGRTRIEEAEAGRAL